MRRLAAALMLSLAVSLPVTPAAGDEGDAGDAEGEGGVSFSSLGAQAFDAVLLRPLGAIASATGFAMFLASAPFAAPAQELPTTWDVFVLAPVEYTFERPLGDF